MLIWLIILFCVFCIVVFTRMFFSPFLKKKVPGYYDGPQPTKEEKKFAYVSILDHVERWPDGSFSRAHPEYMEEIQQVRRYNELDLKLINGDITQGEYDKEIEKLMPGIN